MSRIWMPALAGLWVGCVPMGGKSYDDEGVSIDDATVLCDAGASAWDDLFLFEAWTSGEVVDLEVEIYDGGDRIEDLSLDEEDDGYWMREEWADDIGTDCDDFSYLRFVFTAEGEDGSTAEAEAAG